MNIQFVDRFVCHDDQTFFCRLCGRAGFRSVAAVRGHLAFCPSRKGEVAQPVASKVAGGAGAGAYLRGQESSFGAVSSSFRGQLRGQESSSDVVSSSFQAGLRGQESSSGVVSSSLDERFWAMMQDISQRLGRMEQVVYNEMPHQVAVAQAQRQSFGDSWVKWVIIAWVALWFLRKLGDDGIVKRAGSKIGDKMLGKAIDGLLGL